MGAYGALDLLSRCPHTFAATVAIAGAGDPLFAPPLARARVWLFHAAVDDQVGVNGSRRMLQVLRSRAPNPAPKPRAQTPRPEPRAQTSRPEPRWHFLARHAHCACTCTCTCLMCMCMCMHIHIHSWSPQALLSARRAPPVLVRVNASGGRAGGGATDAQDGLTGRQRPAVRVPAARVLRSGDGEVRYTEYLGADGNAHTASIWWALSDPALGAWAFGAVRGGGAPSPSAAAAAAAALAAAPRRRKRRAAAAESQLQLRQLTRVARRVDYSDPTVAGWRGDGLPANNCCLAPSERAPSRERSSRHVQRKVNRGLARVRDAQASCPLALLR